MDGNLSRAKAGRIAARVSKFVLPRVSPWLHQVATESLWTAEFLQRNMTTLRCPVVLISQVQRSGGTLLSQLFDGHPNLAGYPGELKFGSSLAEDAWPSVSSDKSYEDNFDYLHDSRLVDTYRKGFTKSEHDPLRYAFLCSPSLHRDLFLHSCAVSRPQSPREIFNCYFSAFFGAWLNCRSKLYDAKWITAFSPRVASDEKNMEAFFRDYPDGRLIQVLREPNSWLSSAKGHRRTKKRNLSDEQLLDAWSSSTRSMIRNRKTYGNSVIIVPFEQLISNTRAVMQQMCAALELEFDAALLVPTFNRETMRANSSFAVEGSGIIQNPLSRVLADAEKTKVSASALQLYEEAFQYAIGA